MKTLKRLTCLLLGAFSVLSLISCADSNTTTNQSTTMHPTNVASEPPLAASEPEKLFTTNDSGNFVSPSGEEYIFLANEGILYYLGETYFIGSVEGEQKSSSHLGLSYKTGFYALQHDKTDSILIRARPNNEWFAIYRKATLPPLDYSVENCIRLELLTERQDRRDSSHTTCGDGITDAEEIQRFLTEIRSQQSPSEAGFYDMIKKPNGMLENCYEYGIVFGFFEDEPNVAVAMEILSFNDLAYAITIDSKQYVLPDIWLQRLLQN